MKITSIKQQQKRSDRFSVYIDGRYAFSLGEVELIKAGIRLNQELTAQDIEDLKQRAIYDKAYDRVLNYLSIRPRSTWEVRDYLRRKEYSTDTTELILNKLSKRELLNDLAFARSWIQNRRLSKAVSKQRLTHELRQKRISDAIIQNALGEDETDERAVLKDLINRKRQQPRYQDNLKLMQYLSRQGFTYDDIKNAMEEVK